LPERGERGKGRGRGGVQLGERLGLAMMCCRRGARPVPPLFGLFSGCSREEENNREEEEEKIEKRKEKKRRREGKKGEKWEDFQTWKFLKNRR
jgi:hypothetical protein